MFGEISLEADVGSPALRDWAQSAVGSLATAGFEAPQLYEQVFDERPVVVFVLGGPGAGKGTQCDFIVEHFGYKHISAGDCLRAERESGSANADLINTYIREGQIVPVEITVKLLLKAMQDSGKKKFLIDGFPRNLDNLDGWIKVVSGSARVEMVLFFDCSEAVMERRLLIRGETSGRSDDEISVIRKRFTTYNECSRPIIQTFDVEGKVRHINADRPKEEVWVDVQRAIAALDLRTGLGYFSAAICAQLPSPLGAKEGVDKFRTEALLLQAAAFERFGAALKFTTRVGKAVPAPSSPAAAAASSGGNCGSCWRSPRLLGVLALGAALGYIVTKVAK